MAHLIPTILVHFQTGVTKTCVVAGEGQACRLFRGFIYKYSRGVIIIPFFTNVFEFPMIIVVNLLIERISRSLLRGYCMKEEFEKTLVSRIQNSIVAQMQTPSIFSRAKQTVYPNRAIAVKGYPVACYGVLGSLLPYSF